MYVCEGYWTQVKIVKKYYLYKRLEDGSDFHTDLLIIQGEMRFPREWNEDCHNSKENYHVLLLDIDNTVSRRVLNDGDIKILDFVFIKAKVLISVRIRDEGILCGRIDWEIS